MTSLVSSAPLRSGKLGRTAALALLVAFAALAGAGLGRAPVSLGDSKTVLLIAALAVGAVALCLGYLRPLPVLCAGMALLSFARIQPLTPADGAIAVCMLLTLVGPLRLRPTMPAGAARAHPR
jgi:hypothetical protein